MAINVNPKKPRITVFHFIHVIWTVFVSLIIVTLPLVCSILGIGISDLFYYTNSISGVIFGGILGVIFGISSGIISKISSGITFGIISGIISGGIFGVIFGISPRIISGGISEVTFGIISGIYLGIISGGISGNISGKSSSTFGIISRIVSGIISGGISAILFGIILWTIWITSGIISKISSGVTFEVVYGISLGIPFMITLGIVSGITFGVIFGITSGIIFGITSEIIFGISSAVAFGIISGVVFGVIFGISSGVILGVTFGITSGFSIMFINRFYEQMIKFFEQISKVIKQTIYGITHPDQLKEYPIGTAIASFSIIYAITILIFSLWYYTIFLEDYSYFKIADEIACPIWWHFFYFSLVTIATVGYGDISPIGIIPQVLVVIEILVGLGLVSFYLATIFQIIARIEPRDESLQLQERDRQISELISRIAEFTKQNEQNQRRSRATTMRRDRRRH